MDGATLQARILSGLGKAATRIGLPYTAYRAYSMIDPIVPGNIINPSILAAFAPTSTYSFTNYNKPQVPDWTVLVDASALQAGDWLISPENNFYIAEIQQLLPIPAVQCNRTVSINRAGYTTVAPLEPTQTLIARALPVFMFNKRDREATPRAFPAGTDSKSGTPSWTFYINSRGVGDIRKNDVITDENGANYSIDIANPTSFGYIVLAHDEKP